MSIEGDTSNLRAPAERNVYIKNLDFFYISIQTE